MINIRQDVVGPNNFKPGATPTPTPAPKPGATVNANTLFDKINKSLADKGVKPPTGDDQEAASFIDSIMQDPAKALEIGKLLKARDKKTGNSIAAIKNLFNTETELATIAAQANGDYNKLITLLNEDFVELGKPASTGPALPSKQINEIDPTIKAAIVRSVYQSKLGRDETPEELKAELTKIDKGIATGQTATTKVVGGKTVTTYTPGYSQAVAEQQISTGIKGATEGPVAQDYKEKQSLDFIGFLNGLKGI
jgi:hypothetical protein